MKIPALYHVICMMWARSKYYGVNSRMTVLFRMVNNMMIESATKHLDPGSLFQGEPDESLVILGKVIRVLEFHRACFKTYRDKLSTFIRPNTNPVMWTFRLNDIFERFDQFMERLYTIRNIFDTAHEFYKVEKIELGGLKGRNLSRGIQEIFSDFKNFYIKWSHIQFDPLDPSPKANQFERERKDFEQNAEVLERKLAAILVQAFDECYTIESLIKLIVVCGSLLQRPIIFKEIKEKLDKLVDYYNKDLDTMKNYFDKGSEDIKAGGVDALQVDRGFPPVAGALTWIKKIKTRITKPIDDLPSIEIKDVLGTVRGKDAKDRFTEMCTSLDSLEKEIFEQWNEKVPNEININMAKHLLKLVEDGQLELNFDPALVGALKEVKHLKAMEKENIPKVAVELFNISNELWVSWSFDIPPVSALTC